jgi:hypothetical protein
MTPITKIPRSIKPSAAALLHGVGNSNDFYQWVDANKNAFEYRFNSLATSGDSRGVYAQMKFSGAGGGEVIRAFAKASTSNVATGATVNGIHATLSVDASSSVSGAGNAQRLTIGAAAASRTLGGTCAALQLDSDIGANNTVPASWSFVRVTDSGSVRLANLLNIPAAANGTMFAAHTTQVMTHSIKIVDAAGTAYYIMCTNAATNRS